MSLFQTHDHSGVSDMQHGFGWQQHILSHRAAIVCQESPNFTTTPNYYIIIMHAVFHNWWFMMSIICQWLIFWGCTVEQLDLLRKKRHNSELEHTLFFTIYTLKETYTTSWSRMGGKTCLQTGKKELKSLVYGTLGRLWSLVNCVHRHWNWLLHSSLEMPSIHV